MNLRLIFESIMVLKKETLKKTQTGLISKMFIFLCYLQTLFLTKHKMQTFKNWQEGMLRYSLREDAISV